MRKRRRERELKMEVEREPISLVIAVGVIFVILAAGWLYIGTHFKEPPHATAATAEAGLR